MTSPRHEFGLLANGGAGLSVRLTQLTTRHSGYAWTASGKSIYRKHVDAMSDAFRRERAAYSLFQSNCRVRSVVPKVRVEIADRGIVETHVPEPVATLRAVVARGWTTQEMLFHRTGQALAAVHAFDMPTVAAALSPAERPAALGLANPTTRLLQVASVGSVELAKVLQLDTTVRDEMARLASIWEPTAFIHNDLKWDNILVHPRDGAAEPTEITLIDWEMAGPGDPCWDIGTVLSEFLAFWALSIPIVAGEPPDTYMHLARYPLEDLQPAIGAFWQGYAAAMGFDPTTACERLIRSTRYAGARLIQTAYERTQTMSRLTPQIYLLLQLSLNVLEQPEDAAELLLGLTP